jgi:hypothetical protein
MRRNAHWIWRQREGGTPTANPVPRADYRADENLFLHFRRAFSLDRVPESVPVRVSADGRYHLFVNGTYLGRGPARCEPLFQTVDAYDIAAHLRSGENVIAALVHSYGRDMSWYELPRTSWSRVFGCGGFYFESDALPQANSGSAWRYTIGDAWERDTAPGPVGFVEVYDARKAVDAGWLQGGFDDAAWQPAAVLAAPGFAQDSARAPQTEPFPTLVPRDIPPLLEEHRDAVRIISIAEVPAPDDGDPIAIAERAPEPLSTCTLASPDAMLAAEGEAVARIAPGRALTFIADFERDVTGYPRFEVDAPAGATIDVAYGEQLDGSGRVPVQRGSRITSQNVHRYIARDGAQSWEKFDRAGFRYLQLTISAPDGAAPAEVRLRRVNVNFTSYPVEPRGAFACSDETLTRIWQAGAYTMQLCMQDGFEDCPSREQRQWVGDAYVEAHVNFAAFGDPRLTARLIRQVAQSQMRDGMTQMATPGDISGNWPVYIVDYCLAWIATARAYLDFTDDLATITEVFPSIQRAVAWFERHVGDEGLLWNPPGWVFIDWAEVDRRGACTALNALLVMALNDAAVLADALGAHMGSRWRTLARRIGQALNDNLWDEQRGAYADALLEQPRPEAGTDMRPYQSRRISQQANAAMLAAGIAPRERWHRVLDYITDEARLVETGSGFGQTVPFDEETQVVLAQPFFSHYLHRALAAAGRTAALLDNIRMRWAPMLDADGTGALWEHWHGRESRCHAWSATPVYDLSREVLGVRATSPGFAAFDVAPTPHDLAWAEGRYPTPLGDIGVSWRRDAAAFTLTITVPPNAEATAVTPDGVRHGPFGPGVTTVTARR